jgi:hypothetical protein
MERTGAGSNETAPQKKKGKALSCEYCKEDGMSRQEGLTWSLNPVGLMRYSRSQGNPRFNLVYVEAWKMLCQGQTKARRVVCAIDAIHS